MAQMPLECVEQGGPLSRAELFEICGSFRGKQDLMTHLARI
jgi:hypothetical protein